MEWRTVGEFDNYEVSDDGVVRRRLDRPGRQGPHSKPGNVLAVQLSYNGYPKVAPFDGHKLRPRFVHRLVAIAFIGPVPDSLEVNHKNGIKQDNRVSNLEYVTKSENARHAFHLGLRKSGERHHQAKLSDSEVAELIALSNSLTRPQLVRKFKASRTTVDRILNRSGRFATRIS